MDTCLSISPPPASGAATTAAGPATITKGEKGWLTHPPGRKATNILITAPPEVVQGEVPDDSSRPESLAELELLRLLVELLQRQLVVSAQRIADLELSQTVPMSSQTVPTSSQTVVPTSSQTVPTSSQMVPTVQI